MKIFSAAQLHEADKQTIKKHKISTIDLMENAGTQIFNWLHHRMQGAQVPIHIFCGIGNNGGDGLVVGRMLINHGYNVTIYVANFTDKRSKCFLINYDRIKDITKKWPILMTSEDDFPEINPEDIIIDALFGIGLNRPPEGWVKQLIIYLNNKKAFKLAIDIPSGLSANEPVMDFDAILKASHTLTFQAPKLAFFLPETGKFVPYFEVLDIGLDPEYLHNTQAIAQLIGKKEAQQFYRQREKYDHKGTFGHTLIVAGSFGKIGAAVLASKAAFRIGTGMVTSFVPECGYNIVQSSLPEAMVLTDKEDDLITDIEYNFQPSAIAVGMGIGTKTETVNALQALLTKTESPLVIDADALNCISENKDLLNSLPKHAILTPHPKELERLIGNWKNDYDKIKKVKKFSKKHDVLVVVKGANTLVILADAVYINTTGNPGMGTAGSGDVLSGAIAGLLAQGYDPLMASVFAVYLHGSAGNIVSQERSYESVMASDIADALGSAYLALFEPELPPEEAK